MPNTLLTPTWITRKSLDVLHNTPGFLATIDKQYSTEFKGKNGMIGSTCNVKLPPMYYVRRGPVVDIQPITQSYVPLTITSMWGIDLQYSDAEKEMSLENYESEIIKPAMLKLATQIELDIMKYALLLYNQVGTYGVYPGTPGGTAKTLTDSSAPIVFESARSVLFEYCCPPGGHRLQIDTWANTNSAAALAGLIEPGPSIAEQYTEGVIKKMAGFGFVENMNLPTVTCGTHAGYATAVVSGSGQTGPYLQTRGWTANSNILNGGEIFCIGAASTGTGIGNVYGVNPDNQGALAYAQRFVVNSFALQGSDQTGYVLTPTAVTSDANGNALIPISPSIIPIGTKIGNGTVSASPADGTPLILLSGAANESHKINIAYHPKAFTLATIDLEVPPYIKGYNTNTGDSGIAGRFLTGYDMRNGQYINRFDVMGGAQLLRPQFGVRIAE
jgi:hypothetical protein